MEILYIPHVNFLSSNNIHIRMIMLSRNTPIAQFFCNLFVNKEQKINKGLGDSAQVV
jgi:hypothetical protein